MADTMLSPFEEQIRIVVEKIFNNWSDLRLAVEHGMGGRNGQQVAIQIMDYVFQYCIGNENITVGELQSVIEELMDEEFNTLCADDSIPEISKNLVRYIQMSKDGKFEEIDVELSKLPQGKEWLRPDVKINYTAVAEDSSDDEDDIEDDDSDVDMEEETNDTSTLNTTKTSQDHFDEPEPGWTTVRTKRK